MNEKNSTITRNRKAKANTTTVTAGHGIPVYTLGDVLNATKDNTGNIESTGMTIIDPNGAIVPTGTVNGSIIRVIRNVADAFSNAGYKPRTPVSIVYDGSNGHYPFTADITVGDHHVKYSTRGYEVSNGGTNWNHRGSSGVGDGKEETVIVHGPFSLRGLIASGF